MYFDFEKVDINNAKKMNAQLLAFVGDGVHSLFVRTMLSTQNVKPNIMHKTTTEYVKASGQSHVILKIEKLFTADELEVYKRARNYKTNNTAKHASVIDYKRATGWEAVLGFLYLTGQKDRLNELLKISMQIIGEENENRG